MSLDEVRFASASARTRAEEAGLAADDFEGLTPSGKSGFKSADVAEVVAKQDSEAGVKVESVAELVDKLRNVAGVI